MPLTRRRLAVAVLLAALAATACSAGSIPTPSPTLASPSGPASAPPTPTPIKLVVGLGYIPSVQFAPFYLAEQAGLGAHAGNAMAAISASLTLTPRG